MTLRCAACQKSASLIWAHNGGVDTHRWDQTDDERDCTCGPKPICAGCDAPLLKEHGFVVLDAACFGHETLTLQ